jgi:hypothetical protein
MRYGKARATKGGDGRRLGTVETWNGSRGWPCGLYRKWTDGILHQRLSAVGCLIDKGHGRGCQCRIGLAPRCIRSPCQDRPVRKYEVVLAYPRARQGFARSEDAYARQRRWALPVLIRRWTRLCRFEAVKRLPWAWTGPGRAGSSTCVWWK